MAKKDREERRKGRRLKRYNKALDKKLEEGSESEGQRYATFEETEKWREEDKLKKKEEKGYKDLDRLESKAERKLSRLKVEVNSPTINGENVGNAVSDAIRKNSNSTLEDVEAANDNAKNAEELSKNINNSIQGTEGAQDEDYQAVKNAIGNSQGKPQFSKEDVAYMDMAGATEEEFVDALAEQQAKALAAKANAPLAAVEALNLEHYFPNQGRSIAAGNFTGRYIGSRTIFSGFGSRAPISLVDARRRALERDAKEKAKAADKYFDMIDTAPQYNEALHEHVMEGMDWWLEKTGMNATELLSGKSKTSRQFLRWYQTMKDKAKEIDDLDERVRWIREHKNDEGVFFTDEQIKLANDIVSAQYDMEGFLTGKYDLNVTREKLKGYENMYDSARESVELWNTVGPDQRPIKVRGDINLNDPEVANGLAEALVKKPGQDNDQYISGITKYYDIDGVWDVIDDLFKNREFHDETEKGKKDMFATMMGYLNTETLLEQEVRANKNFERYRFKTERKDNKSWYTVVNEGLTGVNENGKTFQDEMAEVNKKYPGNSQADIEARQKEMARIYRSFGVNPVYGENGEVYMDVKMPEGVREQFEQIDISEEYITAIDKATGKPKKVTLKQYFDGTSSENTDEHTFEFLKLKDTKQKQALIQARKDGYIFRNTTAQHITNGYVNKNDNRAYTLTAKNSGYAQRNSAGATTIVEDIGYMAAKVKTVDKKTGETIISYEPIGVEVSHKKDLANPGNTAILDGKMTTSTQKHTTGSGIQKSTIRE